MKIGVIGLCIHLILFLALGSLGGCKGKNQSASLKEAIIIGTVNPALHLDGRWLYLYANSGTMVPIDSTIVTHGKFRFEIDSTHVSIPFLAKISYRDTTRDPAVLNQFKIKDYIPFLRPIGIHNPYRKSIESRFYVDYGSNDVVPYNDETKKMSAPIHEFISNGTQNEPFYKGIEIRLSHDSLETNKNIAYNKSLILQYPKSYYLLQQFYTFREHFKPTVLQLFLSSFDSNAIRHSGYFEKFKLYFDYKSTHFKGVSENLFLESSDGRYDSVFRNGNGLTLLIFWASWCRPCREEIPALKGLNETYKKEKRFSILSISIDENKDSWRTALLQEKMPWKQFVTNNKVKDSLDIKYNIYAVPLMFLLDANNNIIERCENGDSATLARLQRHIDISLNDL